MIAAALEFVSLPQLSGEPQHVRAAEIVAVLAVNRSGTATPLGERDADPWSHTVVLLRGDGPRADRTMLTSAPVADVLEWIEHQRRRAHDAALRDAILLHQADMVR